MPHDRDGALIGEGDLVYVPCFVKNVCTGEDYCNVSLETVERMYPGEYRSAITLNARQVIKATDVPPVKAE